MLRWAADQGVLVGTSAGAMLMTPTIAADALFSNGSPEATADGAGFDLVPFEFFPHLDASPAYEPAFRRYSRFTPRPILACPDGSGVVVSSGRGTVIGRAV